MTLYLNLFAVVTGFFLVSIWLKEIISLLYAIIASGPFGFRVKTISFWGFGWTKDSDNYWHRLAYKRSALIQYNVGVDIYRQIPEDIDRREKIMLILRDVLLVIVSAVLVFLTRHSIVAFFTLKGTFLDAFLAGLSVGHAFHTLVSIGILIYTYAVAMKKLGGYCNSLIKRMRAGEPIAEMNLRPIDELPYQNPSKIERMMYYSIYLPYLLLHNDTEGMRTPIYEMTEYFRNRDYIVQETLSYYWLIFYYSRYELNPQAATEFFERVKGTILTDPDANSKRVLAYYAFGIERDNAKAQRLVNEGLAVVDKFSLPGDERELERRLLGELQGFLDKARPNAAVPLND